MFLALEGVDASGKTTAARMLAEYFQGIYYPTPPKGFLGQRREMDEGANPEEHYRFYLRGVQEASREIAELLLSGKTVVCDRYWASTWVYHVVMGANVLREDFQGIVLPDITILLTVSPEVQSYRFIQRGMSAGDKRLLNHQEAIAREFKKTLASQEKKLVTIDTSHLTLSEVVAQAIADIKNVLE